LEICLKNDIFGKKIVTVESKLAAKVIYEILHDKTKFWTWRTTAVAAFVGEADTTLHKASTTYITLNPK